MNKSAVKSFFLRILNFVTFADLAIRKKFILFSAGTLFWIVVTSAIGFIMLFYLNEESGKLVDIVEPHQKVLNGVVRKLSFASIGVHEIFLSDRSDEIRGYLLKAHNNLEESRSDLDTLRSGGVIKESSQEGERIINSQFYVRPVVETVRAKVIQTVISDIKKLETLLTEIDRAREPGKAAAPAFRENLSGYDTITQNTIALLNKTVIDLSREGGAISLIIKNGFHTALILIILTLITGSSLSIIFGVLISLNLVKPINEIVSNFRAFTSKKDYEKKIKATSKDEIGTLADEYNKFMASIEALTSFKKIIEEDETVDDVYLRLGNLLTREFGLSNCVIYEISTHKNIIKPAFPPDVSFQELRCNVDILLNCDLCRVKRTGHIIASLENTDICKSSNTGPDEVHVCIPIFISGKVGGVAQFVTDKNEAASPEFKEKISKAQQYITEAQPVLEAKRTMRAFKESSLKDGLTGLYNRRFLEETSDSLVAGVQRRNTTLGFLMCDLDFFKEVNDKYGHDVGDTVLKETSNVIKKSVRTSDLVIRFGGEEFLVLLIDIQAGTSVEIAEKIRASMEGTKIKITAGFISKNISIGICEFPHDTQSFWEAIKFADVALYKAKDSGRNRVMRFAPEMWTEERF